MWTVKNMWRFIAIWFLLLLFAENARGCTWKDSPFRCASGPCVVGTYYEVDAKGCMPCHEGSYMAADGHNCTSCKPCTVAIAENNEGKLATCTRSHDTKLGCKENYFMTIDSKGLHYEFSCWRCSPCKKGEQLVEKCTANKNTVCTSMKGRQSSEV